MIFYVAAFLFPTSPGMVAWKLFKSKRGKISLIGRDLICDSATLLTLPKNEHSLDEFTNVFKPFVPTFVVNGENWKQRRKALSHAIPKMDLNIDFDINLSSEKGDVYWKIFATLFTVGFELIFGRKPTDQETSLMYPGIVDMNRLVKRQTGIANKEVRDNLYQTVVKLLKENNPQFILFENPDFQLLDELSKVSIVAEDLLTSICIQCTDLTCHLLLLFASYPEEFKKNLDNCINETLRLYPLTDLWTRRGSAQERGWVASLIQLNRSGWDKPEVFFPDRWNSHDHPLLISWGFDTRGCPAKRAGTNLSKTLFLKITDKPNFWIQPASNFKHERTFPNGCQLWLGYGIKPNSLEWKFKGHWKNKFFQWINCQRRLFSQHELN